MFIFSSYVHCIKHFAGIPSLTHWDFGVLTKDDPRTGVNYIEMLYSDLTDTDLHLQTKYNQWKQRWKVQMRNEKINHAHPRTYTHNTEAKPDASFVCVVCVYFYCCCWSR